MLGSNRFTDFFTQMPSAPPAMPRKDRRPVRDEEPFHGTETAHAFSDTGRSFSESVCERLGLHPNQYENEVFQQCLYGKARILRPLLQFYNRNFFEADRDLVRRVGKIRWREELTRELDEFYYHPKNGNWLRRRFKLRISCRKIVALVKEVMPELRAGGSAPYGLPPMGD
jgi:hypothetical protein